MNNAGLDGQSTYGHLVLLRDVMADLRPRVAVFLIGVNDIGLDAGNPYDTALAPSRSTPRAMLAWLTEHSALAGLAQNLARVARTREAGFGHFQIDLRTVPRLEDDARTTAETLTKFSAALPAYESRVDAIVAASRALGIEPVLVTQPLLFGDAVDPTTGVDLSKVQAKGAANGKLWWQVQERYNDVTRRVAAARGVTLVDAAREMPKDSRYFYDFMHFTNEGAVRLGDIIAASIAPRLRQLTQSRG